MTLDAVAWALAMFIIGPLLMLIDHRRTMRRLDREEQKLLRHQEEGQLAAEVEEALLTEGLRQVDIETLKYSTRLPAGIQQINGRYYLPSDSVFTWKHV